MITDWDVVVIGAGPAGAVAACQVARQGRTVLLLEKKRFPRRKVCGACLNHAAVTLLEENGFGDSLRECGGSELTQFEMRAGSRPLRLALPSGGLAISRAVLDQRLVEAAIHAGVMFRDGRTATVGRSDGRTRHVRVRDSSAGNSYDETSVFAKVVLVADGLGHPSLHRGQEVRDRPVRNARVGAGCEIREFPPGYAAGTIHMGVGRGGYVGLVQVEASTLNIAAAFDTWLLRASGGPAQAAAALLSQAGFPGIAAMHHAEWLGTPALTRTTLPVASERLFVLGDAAGYVEPFTGEGIGWALSSGVAIAPLASASCQSWRPSLAAEWSREYAFLVRRRQQRCRALAAWLKHPTCVRLAMAVLPSMPRCLQPIVRSISLPRSPLLIQSRSWRS